LKTAMLLNFINTIKNNGLFLIAVSMLIFSCGQRFDKLKAQASLISQDTVSTDTVSLEFEPDSSLIFNLFSEIQYSGDTSTGDTLFTGFAETYSDDSISIFCFRGGPQRNISSRGIVSGKPVGIDQSWSFVTEYDSTETEFGIWGGGAGWTGQPLLICWDTVQKQKLGITNPEFLNNDEAMELIIGSLCGNIYFLDAATGKPTREHLSIGNPIKGTVSVDPRKNGLLYVGQGIQVGEKFGAYIFDMFNQKEIHYQPGYDHFAYCGWGAFDSNATIDKQTGTVFWPGENGIIYRFVSELSRPVGNLTKLRYRHDHTFRHGIESAMAAIGKYGFIADNSGTILCINLQTMKPVWNIDNFDDTDASIMIDEEKRGKFYLYTGNEVDKLGPVHDSYFRKLDAENGSEIWRISRTCHGSDLYGKVNSGGMLSSPVSGKHLGAHLVYCLFARTDEKNRSELVAVNKATGKEAFTVTLDNYTWSSPSDFYDNEGNIYLFFADVKGKLYIIDGLTGELLVSKQTNFCFESSPVIIDNHVYIASRGKKILCLEIDCD